MHGVQQVGALTGQAAVHEPVRLVEFVGPLGDDGGRAQQEGLGERVGRLGEQVAHPPHRVGRRDQARGGGVPDEQCPDGGADQFGLAFGGVAQPSVHLPAHRLVVVGQQGGRALQDGGQFGAAVELAVDRAQHLHGGAGPAAAGQRGAQGHGRTDPVLRCALQLSASVSRGIPAADCRPATLQGAQFGQQPLSAFVGQGFLQGPAQEADGVVGPVLAQGLGCGVLEDGRGPGGAHRVRQQQLAGHRLGRGTAVQHRLGGGPVRRPPPGRGHAGEHGVPQQWVGVAGTAAGACRPSPDDRP